MFKKLQVMVLLLCSTYIHAKEYLPKGCQAIALEDKQIHFASKPQQLLFFHNITESEIWLANRETPKLTIGLQASCWNVLYMPIQEATWRCIQSQKGHEQQVSCKDVMAVCEWLAEAPKSLQTKNNLWLVENQSITFAKAYLQRMGWLFDKVITKSLKQKTT